MSTVPGDPGTPGYGQQQPDWGSPQAPGVPQSNGKAIGALVASILGFFCGVGFIVGLILGYSARNEIRASGGRQTGDGAATAAIVIGWVGVGLTVLGVIIASLFFVGAVAAA